MIDYSLRIMSKLPANVKKAQKLLTDMGYVVKRPTKYKLHSFEIEEGVLREFLTHVASKKRRVKDCATEALALWLESNKP